MHRSNHRVLCTIAGFDPTGGAGIGVDLAVFEAFGAVGKAVVTVETEQDEGGVRRLGARDPALVAEELARVLVEDDPAALKIGALGTLGIVETVAAVLAEAPPRPVVLDPVLEASSGGALLAPDAIAHLHRLLGPHVTLLTPNVPEAARLIDLDRCGEAPETELLASVLVARGWSAALVKGGHATGATILDALCMLRGVTTALPHPRLDGPEVRGTGCALSAAIAGQLAAGVDLERAATTATAWLHDLIAEAHAAGRRTLDPSAVPLPSREPKE